MTLECTQSSVVFARGAEAPVAVPVPFPLLEADHLSVSLVTAAGETVHWAAGVNYKVRLNRAMFNENALATIELLTPMPEGSRLVVRRVLPLTQENAFFNGGPNSPIIMEYSLDKLTMIVQQQQEQLDGQHGEIGGLGGELARIGETCARLDDGLRRQREDIDAHRGQLDGLRVDMDDVGADCGRFEVKLNGLTAGMATQKEELQRQGTELGAATDELAELRRECARLEAAIGAGGGDSWFILDTDGFLTLRV